MDIIITSAPSATNIKSHSPELERGTPPRISNLKPLSFTNGVLKRHRRHHHPPPVVFTYKECLKNHAATLGHHALDGCGEFMPPPTTAVSADPTTLKCAACGCHRSFHRKEPEDRVVVLPTPTIEYQPLHRHRPPPPPVDRSPDSASPPPISSTYAPHMLLALSGKNLHAPAPADYENPNAVSPSTAISPSGRKRFRTKFTQNQRDRMLEFADRVGWKMQKRDEELVNEFCDGAGIDKGVLKVWMHNNKNTFGKKSDLNCTASVTVTGAGIDIINSNINDGTTTTNNNSSSSS